MATGEQADEQSAIVLPVRQDRHWILIRSLRRGEPVDRFLGEGSRALAHWLDSMAFTWSDRARSTMVAVEAADGPESWHQAHGAVAVVRGQVRWNGEPWRSPRGWAARILAGWPSRPYGYPLEGTNGYATVACVDALGRGVVTADHFGSASAYYHLGPDLLVASSRPSLVARALELVGRPPRPDLLGLAWLARAGYQVGPATSYEGVSRLPIGAWLGLTAGGGVSLVERAVPWADASGLGSLTTEEVCDVVEATIADHLLAAVGLGKRVVLDLTGGRDSRLLLAVALSVLDPDSFVLRTVGPPSAPDVQVAAQIAAQLGLEHQTAFPRPRTPGTFGEHAEAFLARTDGGHTAWVASIPHPFEPEVRVSGVSGEMYRVGSYEAPVVDAGPDHWSPSAREAAEVIDAMYERGLTDDVVRPACAAALRDRLTAYFEGLVEIGTPPDQLLYRYHASYHNRVLSGELLEAESDHRVLPLVDVRGVRALAAFPQTARYREAVHLGLITRHAPQLLDVPLASGSWRAPSPLPAPGHDAAAASAAPPPATAGAPATPPARARPPDDPAPAATTPTPPPGSWPVLAMARAQPNQERQIYITEALADPPQEVWDLFDRDVVRGLLDRFDDMAMRSRKQIYAAATVARWLTRQREVSEPDPT